MASRVNGRLGQEAKCVGKVQTAKLTCLSRAPCFWIVQFVTLSCPLGPPLQTSTGRSHLQTRAPFPRLCTCVSSSASAASARCCSVQFSSRSASVPQRERAASFGGFKAPFSPPPQSSSGRSASRMRGRCPSSSSLSLSLVARMPFHR